MSLSYSNRVKQKTLGSVRESDDEKDETSPAPSSSNKKGSLRRKNSNSSSHSRTASFRNDDTASVSKVKPTYSPSAGGAVDGGGSVKGYGPKLGVTETVSKTVDFDDDRSESMMTYNQDYNKELGPCVRCHEVVVKHQENIRVAGMVFHREHFTCSGLCGQLLSIEDSVYVVDGSHVFCEEDYQNFFENICFVCGKMLDGQGVVVPQSLDDPRNLTKATTIHLECANCHVCNCKHTNENPLGIVKGITTVIMCSKDYELAQKKVSVPKCEKCNRTPWMCKCKLESEDEEEKMMEMLILMWFKSTDEYMEARRTGKIVARSAKSLGSKLEDPGKVNLGANSFVKHGRRGNPKSRLVTVDLKRGEIDWGNHRIKMEDIVGMVKGKHTKVFKRKLAENAKAKNCFSIILKNRTLDLEARNKKQRDSWFEGLQKLVVWYLEKNAEGSVVLWQAETPN